MSVYACFNGQTSGAVPNTSLVQVHGPGFGVQGSRRETERERERERERESERAREQEREREREGEIEIEIER